MNPGIIAPLQLQTLQEWFGHIIGSPLAENDRIQTHSSNGSSIVEEAARYIIPSPTLNPDKRIEIYNQQYWWRLFKILHVNFPTLLRLFGYRAFNEEIATPYILRYPPDHWSTVLIGERLPRWIQENYHDTDKALVLSTAVLDWAFIACSVSPRYPPLDLRELDRKSAEQLLTVPFFLQPTVRLFFWQYDLLTFRAAFIDREPEYWTDRDFPELIADMPYRYVLFRTPNGNLAGRKVDEGEFTMLECFKEGMSLETACETIENKKPHLYDITEENLERWIAEWTQAEWLTLTPPERGILVPFKPQPCLSHD